MILFKNFISYYKPYKKLFAFDVIFAIAMSLVDVVIPLIVRYMLYDVFESPDLEFIMTTSLRVSFFLLFLYLIRMGSNFYVTYWGHVMGTKMEGDMRFDLFKKLSSLPFSYFDNNETGHMSSKLISDLADIGELAHHGPENIIISSIKLLGAFIILLNINILLSLVLLLVVFAMAIFSKILNKKMKNALKETRVKTAEVNSSALDTLSGIRVVKSFNNEAIEHTKFENNNKSFVNAKKQYYYTMAWYTSVNGVLQGLMYIIIFTLGAFLVTKGSIKSADIVVFLLYINLFLEPIRTIINFTELYQKGMTGFKRSYDVLQFPNSIQDKDNAENLVENDEDIILDNVSFSYENNEPVLNNLTMKVKKNTTVALVGPSGAGKTTICSLIPRFYDTTVGDIYIYGKKIKDVKQSSLRDHIGIVQQDVYIFNTSIKENISYGNRNATLEEIQEACKLANIHDFIMTLENGYDTYLGERGVKLSGGQKQRISIARVFLKNPPILILDEATAALDNESERFIQKSLDLLAENRTSIVIAHRLSTIKNADKIYYLSTNGIEEEGTHEELLAKNGKYADLYNLQFKE
ncbi:MAG: ABC transporter ATP-binding protein [Lachnospirales bacterium]